jgi:hypothetical protein
MIQSKGAEEIMKLMDLTGKLSEEGVIQSTTAPKGPWASGPGAAESFSKEQVLSMLRYTKAFVKKGAADANMLNKIGKGMEEFVKLKKGDPALDYKEADMSGDQHDEKFGGHSFKSAAKGSADVNLAGKGPGSRQNADELTNLSKKEQTIGQGKSKAGSKVIHST